jgi:hypothetical protein
MQENSCQNRKWVINKKNGRIQTAPELKSLLNAEKSFTLEGLKNYLCKVLSRPSQS